MSLHPPRVPTREQVLAASSKPIPAGLKLLFLILAIIGAIVFIIGAIYSPERAWSAFHANWLFFAGFTQAGIVFVGVQRITTARWSRNVIRFMEGYVAFLPIAFVFLLLILFVGYAHIFPWAHEAYPNVEKAQYYNRWFLTIRDIVIYGLMTVLGVWYVWRSVRLDVGESPEGGSAWARGWRERMRRGFRDERREIHSTHSLLGKIAVWMTLLFAFGWSVLAWDLSMGLSLHFQSTMYSWWFFMGAWLAALSVFALLLLAWNRFLHTADGLIEEAHFHDIGKLVFAFTAFWGYLTFGQYLVIWYGNIAEETFFMRLRLIAPWVWITVVSTILIFVLPFFGLLARYTKVVKPWLFIFTLSSVVGMWIMRYVEVFPSTFGIPSSAPFGIWEVGVALLYLGLWGWSYCAVMDAFPRMRVTLMTSPFRDEIQIPVDPKTMEPLPAHE